MFFQASSYFSNSCGECISNDLVTVFYARKTHHQIYTFLLIPEKIPQTLLVKHPQPSRYYFS